MKKDKNEEPSIAVGMDTENDLEKDASMDDIEKGEYTQVTTLSLDENDPS